VFEADALARSCLAAVASAAARKGVALAFHGAPNGGQLQGDATRIRQVLLNLLSNAIRFTAKGTVTLTAWSEPAPAGRRTLHLAVRDTGVGIRPADLARLFQPFTQVAPDPTGSGLGLAISRQLCQRMGGDLTVASRPGQGSTFTATLSVRPVGVARRAGHLRILLAEDNVMNQRLALKALESLGHTAVVVTDGAQAVALAERWRYDVVLLDVHMPVMDGLEAARLLRARPGPRPLLIGLTADALPEDRERCLRAGMDAHLAKPIDADRLAGLLRTVQVQAAA
jgi:CheY-like chemotaxis protein/anti-sigma regulatory factor (Ser/Thr protein kinase)